jgi:hypothetical protein
MSDSCHEAGVVLQEVDKAKEFNANSKEWTLDEDKDDATKEADSPA